MSRHVFLGGAGRSGTTLLVDMLGLHPQFSPIYETDFVLQLAKVLFGTPGLSRIQVGEECTRIMSEWACDLPHRPNNKAPHERFHHGPHHVLFSRRHAMAAVEDLVRRANTSDPLNAFRAFLSDLFGIHARLDDKPRWINKTPAYVLNLHFLRQVYPDMLFVHCVRDGRDVACSMAKRIGSRNIDQLARWWKGRLEAGERFAAQFPDQVIVVRYEDLLTSPDVALGDVLEFIGESRSTRELLSAYGGDVKLDPTRAHRWTSELTAWEVERFWDVAGETLQRHGYGRGWAQRSAA